LHGENKLKKLFIIVITILLINNIFSYDNNSFMNQSNITESFKEINLTNNVSKIEIVDVNPYENKKSKTLNLNSKKIKFEKSITSKLKKTLDTKNNKYIILEFNENPNSDELK
jgi:hypothetical protein